MAKIVVPMPALHPAEFLRALLDASPNAIIAVDGEGTVQLWNRAAEAMLGWSESEIRGRPLPLDVQLPKPSSGETEIRIARKDGVSIDADLRATPWSDAQGNRRGTLLILADATDQHRIQRELVELTHQEQKARSEARLERRFRELLEAAPDAILEVDREGRIVLLNRVAEKMFGYSREELLGGTVELLIPEHLRARHADYRIQYWHSPATRPMGIGLALQGKRKDGSQFPVEISLSPVDSEEGLRVTAIIRDISERTQAEDRLRAIREEYTHELEERNRLIERANRLKSEFLASMSHELRTPLHTIIGFSELLTEELEGVLDERQKRFFGHIQKDSQHLLELINDLLDLSKIEAGKLQLRREVFDARAAVEEVLTSIRPLVQAKSQSITAAVDDLPALEADRTRFKQILLNLLSNAVKFTPDGGSITIEGALLDEAVEFSVSDTGVGIPKEEQELVFDKFYQVGQTSKGVREGTGLGLAITRHLVAEHGGKLSVASQVGRGSRFSFTIPLSAFKAGKV
ncbi:MAG TPA: PAS domain S-box protein [Bryobacteraceae bacterium]